MEKQFITTSASPKVRLEIHGNLKLKGWDEFRVVVKNSAAEHISLEQRGDEVFVRCTSDCSVRVPRQAAIVAEILHGDAIFKGLDGALTIQEAHGNLDLRSVGPTSIETLHADLSAKNVFGSLTLGRSSGNARVRDVQGDFIVQDAINGDLQLDDVDGSATARCNGNISLRLDPIPGEAYQFTANGNITARLPKDASAVLKFERAAQIIVKLVETSLNQSGDKPYEITLGDGDAAITLAADGNIHVSSQAPDWEMPGFEADFEANFENAFEGMAESMVEQVTSQLESQMAALEQQLNAQAAHLSSSLGGVGLSEEQRQRIEERARQASERASARAQERMRQAQEKLERKLAAAQRRAEQKSRSAERHAHPRERSWAFSWGSPTPPAPPMPPSAPVSDDERLTILRMLEQKQINLEEAEKLLAALEGN